MPTIYTATEALEGAYDELMTLVLYGKLRSVPQIAEHIRGLGTPTPCGDLLLPPELGEDIQVVSETIEAYAEEIWRDAAETALLQSWPATPKLTIEIMVSTHPRHWNDAEQATCDTAARAHLRHLRDFAEHHWPDAVILTDTSLTDDQPCRINAYTDEDDDCVGVRALLELESDLHWPQPVAA